MIKPTGLFTEKLGPLIGASSLQDVARRTEQEPSVEAEVEEWQAEEMEWWARYYQKASAQAGNAYQMRKARGLRKAAARMLRVSRGYARLARLRREVAATIREIIARNGASSPSRVFNEPGSDKRT